MALTLGDVAWPVGQVGGAIEAVAAAAGLRPRAVDAPALPPGDLEARALDAWIEQVADYLAVEAEPVLLAHADLDGVLRSGAPLLCCVGDGAGSSQVVAITGRSRRGVAVVRADRSTAELPLSTVAAWISAPLEVAAAPMVERMLGHTGVATERRRERVRRALFRQRLAGVAVEGIWLLRTVPGVSPWRQAREAGLGRRLVATVAALGAALALLTTAWWIGGVAVLDGRSDPGWMAAWGLLLFSAIPMTALGTWAAGLFSIDAGALLKRRLLAGALCLQPEEVRHQGAGAFLGLSIEASAVERLALGAGFEGIRAALLLVLALILMLAGAGGWVQAASLVLWSAYAGLVVSRYYRALSTWTEGRLTLTNGLVEKMSGHRTRLAQEPRERWHEGEDHELSRYLQDARTLDDELVALATHVTRGWMVAGSLSVAWAFFHQSTSLSLALAIGGLLVASHAFQRLAGAMSSAAGAAVAAAKIGPLFRAASRSELAPPPTPPPTTPPESSPEEGGAAPGERPLLEARDLVFRHGERGEPILRRASLRVSIGDQILLEGASGAGKSTLTAVLGGLRRPEAGILLLDGLDLPSRGSYSWRRSVATAPQFHENHVFQGSFAFNVLMGRRWPPAPGDLELADELCRELGLGPVLDRMPAGLLQLVGETGWQLSHGERSRLYIARALLQDADVLLLDESFAAMDPETLIVTLGCVRRRAQTVLVVAHP